mgnify:CR=1 FL=1
MELTIIVAIIALPLSIALALASGVGPEQGLYTAIVAGFVISLLGGSRVQIAGPTAAFASIVAGIVARNGMDGLVLATILAGIILILMGVFTLGALIKFIPFTITTGFTLGIAVTIAIGQIKDFLGLTFVNSPIETMDKLLEVFRCIGTFNWQALVVGMVCLLILIFWPKRLEKIPASLIAVVVGAAMVALLKMDVKTIGDLYDISSAPPKFSLPVFSFEKLPQLEVSLGPEMKSTGEVLGVDRDYTRAVLKGLMGAGMTIPQKGAVLLSIADNDKQDVLPIAEDLAALGYKLYATAGTTQVLNKSFVPTNMVRRIKEPSPNMMDLIHSGEVCLILNTPTKGRHSERDGFRLRRAATEYKITCLTSLDTAAALVAGLKLGLTEKDVTPVGLHELQGGDQ